MPRNQPPPKSQATCTTAEHARLAEDAARSKNWKRWGPYLAERQWGTVREDYSADGDVWRYFPFDDARRRAYRWGEDGLLGICDRECRLCFSIALWNGKDPILKERLFGLSNEEGNHGEDVKECYYFLDATPSHTYMKGLYKYPQAKFPYDKLRIENRARARHDPEYELEDTGVLDDSRYFDIFVEYAKADDNDLLIRIEAFNRGPEAATLHLLPTLWFRNTWTWGCTHEGCTLKPRLEMDRDSTSDTNAVRTTHQGLEPFLMESDGLRPSDSAKPLTPEMLFTENHSNLKVLYGVPNESAWVRDAFHDYLIDNRKDAVNPRQYGSKVAWYYKTEIAAGSSAVLRMRLRAADQEKSNPAFGQPFDDTFALRRSEADEFYDATLPANLTPEQRNVARQAYAGLLWSKQFYHYIVEDWLRGDPDEPAPPEAHRHIRNMDWKQVYSRDILSMPDSWEYPWFAAWDLAFHTLPLAKIDPDFAKGQLELLLREWYLHPSGQIPAYEFDFSDVNPPVQAWAAWRVYKLTAPRGQRDTAFLERVFHKLLLNFTWWVNRKDPRGNNVFAGGFLGLDNIGVFDRSKPLPQGGWLEQADGTAWMGFFCGTMLSIALELSEINPAYEDIASKFFEHFISIADAINHVGGWGLWDDTDGFYYDQIWLRGDVTPLRVRSMVGLIPLFAVEVLEDERLKKLPGFRKRMAWFLKHRRDLSRTISYMETSEHGDGETHRLLALPSQERLRRMLRYVLDENEFLSPYGVRSLSRVHLDKPYVFHDAVSGRDTEIRYIPGESDSGMFGGNSNWRGPVWMPLNYLLIEAFERYHHFYEDAFQVECPTGSGNMMTLKQVAADLTHRLTKLFMPENATAENSGENNVNPQRPIHGGVSHYATDPHWKDLVLFHEYFHGETGKGLGASHQTGWTALIARLIENSARG